MSKKPKKNYVAWSIDEKDFPKKGTIEEQIKFIVGYGILAPSTHNTQPWTIKQTGKQVNISANFNFQLPYADPHNLGLYISIGAIAENIVQAARAYSMKTDVRILKECAVISFGDKQTTILKYPNTINAITKRKSNKFAYQGELSKQIKYKISKIEHHENIEIKIVLDTNTKKSLTKIHVDAIKLIMQNKKFILELSKWMRPNFSRKYTGMPGNITGNSNVKSIIGKATARAIKKVPPSVFERENSIVTNSSGFLIFGAKQNTVTGFILSGMTIERYWLSMTKAGVVAQPLFAIINSDKDCIKLKKLVGMKYTPVFILRIGNPTQNSDHTPRRIYKWN